MPSISDILASIIRTVVPLVVGWLISLPITKALGLSSDQLTTLVTAGVTAVYYLLVRVLEQYVSPRFGWLLGLAKTPSYAPVTPEGVHVITSVSGSPTTTAGTTAAVLTPPPAPPASPPTA